MYKIVKERREELGFDPEVLGTPEDKISAVVDVREYLSQKLEAMGYEPFQCVHGCTVADTRETDLFEGL
jgi:hypothetical protein